MDNPNVTYKRAFADLTRELGRLPTPNECLGIHDAYKKSWGPAEETVLPPNAAAGRPEPEGFSREPAPQARAMDAREEAGAAGEPLIKPGAAAEPEERRSTPEPPRVNPGASEPAMVVASSPCRRCGRAFERVARRGRPPVMCGECK